MEIISQFPLQAKTFYCNKIHLKKKNKNQCNSKIYIALS